MSLEMRIYAPSFDDSLTSSWIARLNSLDMQCEIHPDFSFNTQIGFLPFKVSLTRSEHQQLIGVPFFTGFEFYISDFDLGQEIKAIKPKQTFIARLLKVRSEPVFFVSPNIDEKLASCRKVISCVWYSDDILELRIASLSALILAKLADGICSYPADNIWYTKDDSLEFALKEIEEFETSLQPEQLKVHKFEKWL